jgi:hypothetical protein
VSTAERSSAAPLSSSLPQNGRFAAVLHGAPLKLNATAYICKERLGATSLACELRPPLLTSGCTSDGSQRGLKHLFFRNTKGSVGHVDLLNQPGAWLRLLPIRTNSP